MEPCGSRLAASGRLSWPSWLRLRLQLLLALMLAPRQCCAQYPSLLNGANLTTVRSPVDPTITISYTVPRGACTTVFDSQEQYAGWVAVPGDYPVNMFFWFVGAREATSMLTVYLNGGPGSSSMFGLFAETGPCEIVEMSATQLGTVAREWGWDRASNMLFVDQPNQVGFSYDTPTNGTLDLYSGNITVRSVAAAEDEDEDGSSLPLSLLYNGTFSSQNASRTANTTALAARAVYHLMQGFLAEFPRYSPADNSSLGVNLFAESYGGHYGPAFARTWQTENARRLNGSSSSKTSVEIRLTALGLINGCVDDLVQGPHYAAMMVNNSYGFHAVPPLQAGLVNASFYARGSGCGDLIAACRAAVAAHDPADSGASAAANSACAEAQTTCAQTVLDPYGAAGRSFYDLAHALPDSFPPAYYVDYLNSAAVQRALGSPVNFTAASSVVYGAFAATGDLERSGGTIADMAALLQDGIRVGLVYGDRDYVCNWLGGEAVSLAVARAAAGDYADRFPRAGYAPVIVNDSYIGGAVRQFANLSFTRVYQAGHFVPASQPETAFEIFARIILGTDVGTGEPVDLAAFNTSGPANATSSLSLPSSPQPTCFVRNIPDACDDDQVSSLRLGRGVIINGIWYPASSDWPGPATGVIAAISGSTSGFSLASTALLPSTSPARTATVRASTTASAALSSLTGFYTATATPGAAAPFRRLAPAPMSVATLAIAVGLFSFIGTEIFSLRLL